MRSKWLPKLGWILTAFLAVVSGIIIFTILHRNHKPAFTGKEKSIAVLPFVNADSLKENDYLSDGMTSEIIHRLSRISGLHVISTNRVRAIKNTHLSPVQIAAELKVA